jgi:hyperosmotically inducible protein
MVRLAVSLLSIFLLSGCEQPGSASAGASRSSRELTAGQRLDQATAEAQRAAGNAALTARVKAALANNVGLNTLKIDVDSNDGVVTLRGPVDTQETRRRAQETAQGVEGVRLLQNQLLVRDNETG